MSLNRFIQIPRTIRTKQLAARLVIVQKVSLSYREDLWTKQMQSRTRDFVHLDETLTGR